MESDISLAFEPENCSIHLSDWLVANSASRRDLLQATPLVKVLGRDWLRYKNYLFPAHSPLQRFSAHPGFEQLDFSIGKKRALNVSSNLL